MDMCSVFADMDEDVNYSDEGDEEDEPREMKYTAVEVETEIDDMIPPGTDSTKDGIDEHLTPRGGGKKRTPNRRQTQALSKRMKRAQMTPDEREKQREKWRMEARMKRMKAKQEPELVDDMDNLSPSKRSTRQASSRFFKIEEPESAEDIDDQDNQVEDDDDDDYGSNRKKRGKRKSTLLTSRRGKRPAVSVGKSPGRTVGSGKKRVGEMTEEEREIMKAKWREEARLKRARQREADSDEYLRVQREKRREQRHRGNRKEESDVEEVGIKMELEDGDTKMERGCGSNFGSRPLRRSEGSGKKRVSEMTEEEREIMKAKWREEARIKRARQRETMTLNDREELLRIQREKRREQRAIAKLTKTEHDNEQANITQRERKRALRALMTPEQRKEQVQKVTLRRIERLAQMTDDERKMWKMNNYLRNTARMGNMTQEEREERKRRQQEYTKRRRAQMTAADLERRKLITKQYRANMSPEKKSRFLAQMRGYYRRRRERLGKNSGEAKVKLKKQRAARLRKVNPNETAEEKAERKKSYQIKFKLKKKLEMQKLLDSGMSMKDIKQKVETPEQRERRLVLQRFNRVKLNLRRRLENEGASMEEIEVQLKELHQTYQPAFTTRPYKPRSASLKSETATDLELLTENDEKKPKAHVITSKRSRVSSSKTLMGTSTPVRRGRPSKSQQLVQKITSVNISIDSVTTDMQLQTNSSLPTTHPQPSSSSAGTSTCSYVSGLQTPQPIHDSAQYQQQALNFQHQKFVSPQQPQQYVTTTKFHFQTQQIYPHQQPQTQPYQTNTNTFQTILDNVGYHHTTTGVHGDYSSSYDNYSASPSTPPTSPLCDDAHDCSDGGAIIGDLPFQPSTSTELVQKRGRPRKDQPPRVKKWRRAPTGRPRGRPCNPNKSKKTSGSEGDMICDECGTAFKRAWHLREHKNRYHNPNYENQTCKICGEKFKKERQWYKHYIQTHVEPTRDVNEKPYMCDVCGTSFRKKNNLDKHKYYMHGDGSKKENFRRCPVCPGEKLFKEEVSLYVHLRREHPGYNRGGHDCYRCDKTFADENEVGLHVKAEHAESYFPCQYCNACRFTQMGLNFHYRRCKKMSTETRQGIIRKAEGIFSLDRIRSNCEFCNRDLAILNLSTHYWEVHNVKEDNFTCSDCRKVFRAREYWVVHMEEKHLKTMEEIKDLVGYLNVATREGLVIKNPSGVRGGVKGNTLSKMACEMRKELRAATKSSSKGGRNRKTQIVVTDEDQGMNSTVCEEKTDEEEEQNEVKMKSKKRRRRHIKVIAEEDDDEEEEKQEQTPVQEPGPKSKTGLKKENNDEVGGGVDGTQG